MNGKTVYLDSSAIVKRYVAERGTEAIDRLYHRSEAGRLTLGFSLWNVGEVLGAFIRARRLGSLSDRQLGRIAASFLGETLKERGLGNLRVVPVRGDLLAGTLPLLLRHPLTQPDGLQIVTCRDIEAEALVSADERLLRAAEAEGLHALHPGDDAEELDRL